MWKFSTFPQQFVFGAGALVENIETSLKRHDVKRVAVLTSPSVVRSETWPLVERALSGFDVAAVLDKNHTHSTVTEVEAMADGLREEGPDALLAVGGGSVSDKAKCLAILLAEGGPYEAHCSTFTPPNNLHVPELTKEKIPIIAVPTTLSAAEVTPGGGAVNDQEIKRSFWDPKVAARDVIFDSAVLRSVPHDLLMASGMNALAHSAEGLYSKGANPFSTALASHAAELITRGLVKAADPATASDDAYLEAAAGTALSGLVISNARVGLHHAICHVLVARAGLSHGVANSVMLPYVLRFNLDATAAAQRLFRDAIAPSLTQGSGDPKPEAWELVFELGKRLGTPSTLSQAGAEQSVLRHVAEGVMQDRGLFFNPKPVASAEVVLDLLQEAWS